MSDPIKLNRTDAVIADLCRAIGYKGRKIKASLGRAPNKLDSYWDGGSKDTYYFYNLDTRRVVQLHSNHPFYEAGRPRELSQLPERVILIEHSIFCGKDCGLTIYSNESDRALLVGGSK